MGIAVSYRATGTVCQATADAVKQAAKVLCRGRSWLHCEPVCFFDSDAEPNLSGSSKPNFLPHADDLASAALEGLPKGTTRDVIDILCQLSREHRIDWEIGCDIPVGFIRNGVADEGVAALIEALAAIGDSGFEDLMPVFDAPADGLPATDLPDAEGQADDDDDDEPRILSFQPDRK